MAFCHGDSPYFYQKDFYQKVVEFSAAAFYLFSSNHCIRNDPLQQKLRQKPLSI
jgi:hypothetical protein